MRHGVTVCEGEAKRVITCETHLLYMLPLLLWFLQSVLRCYNGLFIRFLLRQSMAGAKDGLDCTSADDVVIRHEKAHLDGGSAHRSAPPRSPFGSNVVLHGRREA